MAGVLLNYAFRPFFLLNSMFAVVVMLLWILVISGFGPTSAALAVSPLWHGHEMMFGFAGAAIAGFVLTAVATWTGRPPVKGGLLGALVLSWLAGRHCQSRWSQSLIWCSQSFCAGWSAAKY